jgi:hypothetical protein
MIFFLILLFSHVKRIEEQKYKIKKKGHRHSWRDTHTTIIRPVLEYACQVWHFNIQEYLSEDIEKIQRRALRISLPLMSYREARNFTGIPLLKARRETLCEQFFKKNENNDKLSELLHHKATADYDMRPRCKYNNYLCRTERFRKSFFPQIISKENSK